MSPTLYTTFLPGQGAALAIVVGFAVLSLSAVDFVWLRVLWVATNQLFGRGTLQAVKRERAIFHSQLGAYMASLLFGNLLSSASFIINATWIMEGGITTGGLCTTQAALSQVADLATAFFTAAIAVHTFNSLVLKFRLPLWFCFLTVTIGWTASVVIAIFPTHTQTKLGPFYSINGIFCDISSQYPLYETVIHLVPIFVASVVSAVFYSLVFLILRGTIALKGGLKLNFDPESRRTTMHDTYEYPAFIAAIARSMLWYPIAYVVLMLPHLATCLLSASGYKISNTWRIITAATSAMLGLANVLIFYNTIRTMGPAFGTSSSTNTQKTASFGVFGKAESPVDVAPPVAAMLAPARAFPPPRSLGSTRPSMEALLSHSRQGSSDSMSSGESGQSLLPLQPAYSRLESSRTFDNGMGGLAIDRPIKPASKLNQMLAAPTPADQSLPRLDVYDRGASGNAHSLPAPRREGRSPVVRHPTISVASPEPTPAFTAIPLKTPMASDETSYASRRDSFLNMYASRSAMSTGTSAEGDHMRMPSFGASPGYSSGDDSEIPRSAFGQKVSLPSRPNTSRSLRSEVHTRLGSPESSNSAELSSIAWATLVAHAATSHGGVRAEPSAEVRAMRRRSKSMDALTIPSTLRPRTPSSARTQQDMSRAQSVQQGRATRSDAPTRWDSQAVFHQGPSKTPKYSAQTVERR